MWAPVSIPIRVRFALSNPFPQSIHVSPRRNRARYKCQEPEELPRLSLCTHPLSPPIVMPTYEIHYFPTAGRSDLHRMMIEVGHLRGSEAYKNVFVDGATWPEVKKTMAFGMVPKLVVVEDDGSRKVRPLSCLPPSIMILTRTRKGAV